MCTWTRTERHRRTCRITFTIVALLASGACSAVAIADPFAAPRGGSSTDVVDMPVVVFNNHWLPMRVWVEWPDRNYFLGDVEPGARGTFSVPGYLVARSKTLRLLADPTGSVDQVLSDPIEVKRGHRIEWQLQKVLASSRARIM